MYTFKDIIQMFGEEELPFLLTRMQYMDIPVRQQFIDACIQYSTRPSAGWNGGFHGDPFTPVRNYGTAEA